jgi:hypothetical protein
LSTLRLERLKAGAAGDLLPSPREEGRGLAEYVPLGQALEKAAGQALGRQGHVAPEHEDVGPGRLSNRQVYLHAGRGRPGKEEKARARVPGGENLDIEGIGLGLHGDDGPQTRARELAQGVAPIELRAAVEENDRHRGALLSQAGLGRADYRIGNGAGVKRCRYSIHRRPRRVMGRAILRPTGRPRYGPHGMPRLRPRRRRRRPGGPRGARRRCRE